VIHLDAAIAHIRALEDTLQDEEGPHHLGACFGLVAILALPFFVHNFVALLDAPIGHVLRCGCGFTNCFRLPQITCIAQTFV